MLVLEVYSKPQHHFYFHIIFIILQWNVYCLSYFKSNSHTISFCMVYSDWCQPGNLSHYLLPNPFHPRNRDGIGNILHRRHIFHLWFFLEKWEQFLPYEKWFPPAQKSDCPNLVMFWSSLEDLALLPGLWQGWVKPPWMVWVCFVVVIVPVWFLSFLPSFVLYFCFIAFSNIFICEPPRIIES